MSLKWIEDRPSLWDSDKARIVGGAAPGIFDARFGRLTKGELVSGDWWLVEEDGAVVGYGWMDVVWGDAEILLATDPARSRRGIGSFILQHLEQEARDRGIFYLYNQVRPTHPDKDGVTAFLEKQGFEASEDGSLFRTLARPS